MVASLYNFDEKQDPDPHENETLDPDSHLSEKSRSIWIRIRIKVMRIRNPDYECIVVGPVIVLFSLVSEDFFIWDVFYRNGSASRTISVRRGRKASEKY
jgi:hypothetical protein